MPGITKLSYVQLGKEGTAGSEAAATVIWRGNGAFEDETEVQFVEENVGYLSGVDRTAIYKVGGTLPLEDTPATFEQLPYLLDAGVDSVTGVQDGAGSGYIYTYNFPKTVADTATPATYTCEAGNNQQEEQFLYGFVESFGLSGAAGEALNMNGVFRGRQIATGTKTASLSLVDVEEIAFSNGKLYIDAVDTAFGTTLKSNTLLEATLEVDTGLRAVHTGDGALYFTFTKNVGPEITLDITFEHDTTAVSEKAAWRAETARKLRLIFEGSTFAQAGTAYSKKTLIIDLVGKWETFEAIGDSDGNATVSGTFRARYNSTAAAFAQIVIVNALSALP